MLFSTKKTASKSVIIEKNLEVPENGSFLVKYSHGSPDAYDLSLDGFTCPGGHPEQHGGLESRANGSYYCLEG